MVIRLRQTLRLFDCRFSRCSLHTRGNWGEAAALSRWMQIVAWN